jgi:hypothetical protein
MNYLKNICLIFICLFAMAQSVMAEITVQEARDPQYLQNHGHSPETARLLELNYKQINGISTEKVVKKTAYNWPVRVFKKLQAYIDPAIDNEQFGRTEIDVNPSMNDL